MVYRSPNRMHERQFFYKYVNIHVAKIILSTRQLRWSSPLLFNDPFDFPRDFCAYLDKNELQKRIAKEFSEIITEDKDVNEPRIMEIQQLLRSGQSRVPREVVAEFVLRDRKGRGSDVLTTLQRFWDELIPTFRILCLSKVYDSIPMWAYYTENHRGAVLHFECLDETDSPLLVAKPVIYSDERPPLPTIDKLVKSATGQKRYDWKKAFEDCRYFKSTAWSHEQEWRVVSNARRGETGLFSDWSFAAKELTDVFFGINADINDIKEIQTNLNPGLSHVRMHRASIEHGKPFLTFHSIE